MSLYNVALECENKSLRQQIKELKGKVGIKWHTCKAGTKLKGDAIVIPINSPNDADARLVRCAVWDSRYILVSELLKLETEN